MLAFRRKIIDFGVFFAALTFGVSKFRCSNFDEKSSFLACLLPHLPSACRNFDARISTKNNRFWRAFCRTYLRRVEISMLAFRRKIIDFGVLFAALTSGVSTFRGGILATVSSCFLLAKRRFSMILDTFLHLFLSGSRYVDGDFIASDFKARS